MRETGIEPIHSKPRPSQPGKGHKVYPYLLRDLEIKDPTHVGCSDIIYIPLAGPVSCACIGRRRTLDNRMAEYRFCSVLHGGLRTALQLHTVLTQPVLKHYALNRNRNLSKELDHFTKSPIMNKLSGASTTTTLSQAC